jgi:hypothetical protein
MGIPGRRTTRRTDVYQAVHDRCMEILAFAHVWVQAIPRLAHAFWFMAGALTLIAVKGIRRTLGQSSSLQ